MTLPPFSAEDQIRRPNQVTAEKVLEAIRLVRQGKVSLDTDQHGRTRIL
jgi:hypothetical protein